MRKEKYALNREDLDKSAPIWAHRIYGLLIEKDLTQQELVELTRELEKSDNTYKSVSEGTLTGWFKGKETEWVTKTVKKFTTPKIDGIISVAKVLDVSIDYITGLSETDKKEDKYKVGSKEFGLSTKTMEALEHFRKNKKPNKYIPHRVYFSEIEILQEVITDEQLLRLCRQ